MKLCHLLLTLLMLFSFLLPGCGRGRPGPRTDLPPVEDKTVSEQEIPEEPAPVVQYSETDWPCWRGVNQDGIATDSKPLTKWNLKEHTLWSTSFSGRGHSSPVVCKDIVYVTTADKSKETQSVLAFDLSTGDKLWETECYQGGFPPDNRMYPTNSHASGTPSCDGTHVYATFLNHEKVNVVALDTKGDIVWRKSVANFDSKFGYGASNVIYRSYLIVPCDHQAGGALVALDKATGDIVWQRARPRYNNYVTPRIVTIEGTEHLLISGGKQFASYNPLTGHEIFNLQGPHRNAYRHGTG